MHRKVTEIFYWAEKKKSEDFNRNFVSDVDQLNRAR